MNRVNSFVKQLREYFDSLTEALDELVEDFAKGIKIPENFYTVISAFGEKINILSYNKIYAISGVDKSAEGIAKRIKFLNKIQNLEAAAKYLIHNNPHLKSAKKLTDTIKSLKQFIENAPMSFKSQKFYEKKGGDLSSVIKGVTEGIKKTIATVGNTAKIVADSADSLMKMGGIDLIDTITNGNTNGIITKMPAVVHKLMFLYRRQQMTSRFKNLYADAVKTYSSYENTHGKNIADLKERLNQEFGNSKWEIKKVLDGDEYHRHLIFQGGLVGRVRKNFWRAKPEVQKLIIQAKYDCLMGIIKTAEALDLYYQNFVLETLKDPESIKPIILELETDIYEINYNGRTANNFNVAQNNKMNGPNYQVQNTDDMEEQDIIDRYNRIKKITESTRIPSLISIFTKIASITGNGNLFEKTFVSPDEIYESIVKYLAFKDYLYQTASNNHRPRQFRIRRSGAINFMHNRFKTKFAGVNFDYIVLDIITSMLGNIIAAVDLYNVMNKNTPFSVGYIISPGRLIIGANEEEEEDEEDEYSGEEVSGSGSLDIEKTGSKEIVPSDEVFETYIRVPLLIKFYRYVIDTKEQRRLNRNVNRDIFSLKEGDERNNRVYAALAIDNGFTELYKACYGPVINMNDVKTIVEYCNALYNEYKKEDDPCFAIMNKIAEDVSSKLGLMYREKYEASKRNVVLTQHSDLMKVPKVKKEAPSDKYKVAELMFKETGDYSKFYKKAGQKIYRLYRDINKKIIDTIKKEV